MPKVCINENEIISTREDLIDYFVESTSEPTNQLEEKLQKVSIEIYRGSIDTFAVDLAAEIRSIRKNFSVKNAVQTIECWANSKLSPLSQNRTIH